MSPVIAHLRRLVAVAAMTLVPLVPLTTSCSEEVLPVKGQLMLVLTTNLEPPKDFDTMHVRIVEEGATVPVLDVDYALAGSQAVKLPATLGVVAGSDPNRAVRITVEARSGPSKIRVTREAITRVPRDRIASLPLPIDGLCADTRSTCAPDEGGNPRTCIAGTCQSARVESDALPTFDPAGVFGGGTGNGDGACFDTLACFTNGRAAEIRSTDCSVARDSASGFGFNVAVVRPPSSDGICGSNACLLPLDFDPFTGPIVTGWREAGDRAALPPVICQDNLPVVITTACATKTAPTCGPWSAVGKARDLGDASIPFDGAGFPVGEGGVLGPLPTVLRFLDEDPRLGFVTGTITVGRATDESTISGYKVYWADGPSKKLDLVATLPKTGGDVTHRLAGAVQPGATHLVAFSTTATSELTPGVSVGPVDNYPRKTTITAGGNDLRTPIVLTDPKTDSVLVVGFDFNATRMKAALLRCKADGSSGCTYADISGGEPSNGNEWEMGAAIDPAAQKLIVVSNPGAASPRVLRCDTGGANCVATNTGLTPVRPAVGCRVPVLVDSVNQKLLTILTSNANVTTLMRCDLTGQNCSYQPISPSWSSCPAALIDTTSSKLLVVQSSANQRPNLHRCDLDGTSCVQEDISGGYPEIVSAISAAIDTKNQKLVVATSRTNGPTLYFYRCNLSGQGCTGGDLGVADATLSGPSDPAIVVDEARDRLFVFGYGQTGFYARCNLDGTGCTNTLTFPPGSGSGVTPSAALLSGRLFVASRLFNPSFTTPGIDLVSLLAY